jgi:hypothetical protein
VAVEKRLRGAKGQRLHYTACQVLIVHADRRTGCSMGHLEPFLLEERTVTAPLATAPVLEAKGPVTVPSKSRLKLHTEILSRVIGVFRFTYASR